MPSLDSNRRARLHRSAHPGRLSVLILVLVVCACTQEAVWPDMEAPATPVLLDDGWAVGSPTDQGLDLDHLALLDYQLRERDIDGVDALLIVRHGTLVFEGYYVSGTGVETPHFLASATKSVMSLLVGAAVEQGLILDDEQPLMDFFPEHADIFQSEPKKQTITLHHVLTMTAGLEWDQKDPSERDRDGIHLLQSNDAARYVLTKPLVNIPGTKFLYSGGCSALLSAIVRNVSGLQADAYAEAVLFGPLEINDYTWNHMADGLADSDGGLYMRGRDLAKLGQLCLQGGMWNGERIIPQEWIEASFHPWIPSDQRRTRYGYQWWMYDLPRTGQRTDLNGIVMASGYGGEKLFVIPTLDLVVVAFGCTGGGYQCGDAHNAPEVVLSYYILKAVRDL
jgi:CubicO group peptidase (beta-lactamase class C family)